MAAFSRYTPNRPRRAPEKKWPPSMPVRIAFVVIVGGGLAYLGTFGGAAAFYVSFQRSLLERVGSAPRSPLWSSPEVLEWKDGAHWEWTQYPTFACPRPSRNLQRATKSGENIRLIFDEGEVSWQPFPHGFIVRLFRDELEQVSDDDARKQTTERDETDANLLLEIASAKPADYRWRWAKAVRERYAGLMLTKMLLLDAKNAVRYTISASPNVSQVALIAEYRDGSAKVIGADTDHVYVATLKAGAPRRWKEHPASWVRRH